MANQDIYKIVAEMNKNKTVKTDKIDDIYDLLDEVGKDYSNSGHQTKFEDIKERIKPAYKPAFPNSIKAYDNRSDCFFHILEAIDYGNNNEDYVRGHKSAIDKYRDIASNNKKNFITLEGQVSDEYESLTRSSKKDNFTLGYYDGVEFVLRALDKSRDLMSKKIYEKLIRELH